SPATEIWTARLEFDMGRVEGGGMLRIAAAPGAAATANIQGPMTVDGTDFVNEGTTTWVDGNMALANNAEIDNLPGANFEVTGDNTMATTGGSAIFRNWGIFQKTQGAGGVV